jgi:hypothetical protein
MWRSSPRDRVGVGGRWRSVSDRRWPGVTDWVLVNYQELFEDQDKDQIEAHLLLLLERGKEMELHGQKVSWRHRSQAPLDGQVLLDDGVMLSSADGPAAAVAPFSRRYPRPPGEREVEVLLNEEKGYS